MDLDTGTTPGTPSFDPARLNEIGKRRLGAKGLTCFVHPDRDGLVEAVCIDFGLSARAATSDEAMNELVEVINTAWQLAVEEGAAEHLLNQPNNSAAERQMRRAQFAFGIARTVLFPFQALSDIRSFLTRALVKKYDQQLDTSDRPAFAP